MALTQSGNACRDSWRQCLGVWVQSIPNHWFLLKQYDSHSSDRKTLSRGICHPT